VTVAGDSLFKVAPDGYTLEPVGKRHSAKKILLLSRSRKDPGSTDRVL
jgi:hypothetical protein